MHAISGEAAHTQIQSGSKTMLEVIFLSAPDDILTWGSCLLETIYMLINVFITCALFGCKLLVYGLTTGLPRNGVCGVIVG